MQWYSPEIFRRSDTFGKWLPIACRDIFELETFKASYGYPCPDSLRIMSSPNVETVFMCRNHPINYILVTGKCVAVEYSHYPDSGKYVYQYHIDDDTGPAIVALKECYFKLAGEEARVRNQYIEARGYLMEKKGHSRKISLRGIRILKCTSKANSTLTPFRRYLLASLESLTVRQAVLSKNWIDSGGALTSSLNVAEDPTHYCSLSRRPSPLESYRTFSESIVDAQDRIEPRQEEDTINDADFDTAVELGYDFEQELVKLTQVPADELSDSGSEETGMESSAVESSEEILGTKEYTLPTLGALAITSTSDPRLDDSRSLGEYALFSRKLMPLVIREQKAKDRLGPDKFENVVVNRFGDKKLPAIGSVTYNLFNEPRRVAISTSGPAREPMARLREKLQQQRSIAVKGPVKNHKPERRIQKWGDEKSLQSSELLMKVSSSSTDPLELVVQSLRSFETCSSGLDKFLQLDEILSRSVSKNPSSLFLEQFMKSTQLVARHDASKSSVRSFVIQVSHKLSQHLTDYIFKSTEADPQGRLYFTSDLVELFREVAFFVPILKIVEESVTSNGQLAELITSVVRRFIINRSTEKVVTVAEIRKCIEKKLESLTTKGYLARDPSGVFRKI